MLTSKVYFNDGALSAEAIARKIDGSLTRLGTDYLDPSILITPPPIEDTMETPDSLVKAGKVCALGASEMYAYQLHNMEIVAELNGWIPFTSMQFTKICFTAKTSGSCCQYAATTTWR